MRQVVIQNLGMIVTNKCNLNCSHCERGYKDSKVMSDDVIKSTLDQVKGISNLCLCGGEITYSLDAVEKIFTYIVEKEIYLNMVSTVINGSNYSPRFLELLDYIYDYVQDYHDSKVFFNISSDSYHTSELKRLNLYQEYLNNIKLYKKSKYFGDMQKLYFPVFAEGNAKNLESDLIVPLVPMKTYITYVSRFKRFNKNGLCNIGPIVAVNPEGIITECDASIENQYTKYKYGNVLTDSIEEVMLKNGEVVKPREWLKSIDKEIAKHLTYKNI